MIRWMTILVLMLAAGAANAATFYVADGGTAEKAAATAPETPMSVATFETATFAPGDTIYFMGTIDCTSNYITIPSSGTDGNPITYASYPSNPAILDGGGAATSTAGVMMQLNGKDYLTIDGFRFQNVMIDSETFQANMSDSSTIKNCVFADCYTTGSQSGAAWMEVQIGAGKRLRIEDCTFGYVPDESISSHTGVTSGTLEVYRCTFEDTGSGDAMQFVTTPTLIDVRGCVFIGCRLGLTASTPQNTIIQSSVFTNSSPVMPAAFIYCVFVNKQNVIENLKTQHFSWTFDNCIFYGTGSGTSGAFKIFDAPAQLLIRNCIIKNYPTAFYMDNYYGTLAGGLAVGTIEDSIYHGVTNWIRNLRGTESYVLTQTRVQANTDPKFVSPGVTWATADFSLQSDSPAIDAGADLGYVLDITGKVVPIDGDGDSTAQADIGAYEYGTAPEPEPTPTPTPGGGSSAATLQLLGVL